MLHRLHVFYIDLLDLEIFDVFNDDSLSTDFFVDIEDEICRLILHTHWKSFKNQINEIM